MRIKKVFETIFSRVKNTAVVITSFFSKKRNLIQSRKMALKWIKNNTVPGQGVVLHSLNRKKSHTEVTGYLISTLIKEGELDLAKQYARFLCSVQKLSGVFTASDGQEYVFDSAQALKGLLAASEIWPEFRSYAQKTADYILSLVQKNGRILPMYKDSTEYIHVFMLPALIDSTRILGDIKYARAAQKSLDYYKKISDILNKDFITHDLAYIIEGFIDMGEKDFVRKISQEVFSRQTASGKISAYPNVSWCCSAGQAQFAVIAYKLDMKEQADRALDYLRRIQSSDGGFYGSYGIFGKYFNEAKIGWTNKFFLDAVHLKFSKIYS